MLPVLYRAARQPLQCYRRSPLLANLSRTWRMTVRRCAKVLTGGIVGQRQVSSLASNVGLDVGATTGEADIPLAGGVIVYKHDCAICLLTACVQRFCYVGHL